VGPCKHSAKQKAFGTVLAWAVYFLLRRPKAPISSGGLLGAFERREERGGWVGAYLKPQIHHPQRQEATGRSESHLLDLVDTPGNQTGSFLEPQIRWGVSKACISFATERIQYWVSDPINAGSARMEVRLGASCSRTPKRAAKPSQRCFMKSVGKKVRELSVTVGGGSPRRPRRLGYADRELQDRMVRALARAGHRAKAAGKPQIHS